MHFIIKRYKIRLYLFVLNNPILTFYFQIHFVVLRKGSIVKIAIDEYANLSVKNYLICLYGSNQHNDFPYRKCIYILCNLNRTDKNIFRRENTSKLFYH